MPMDAAVGWHLACGAVASVCGQAQPAHLVHVGWRGPRHGRRPGQGHRPWASGRGSVSTLHSSEGALAQLRSGLHRAQRVTAGRQGRLTELLWLTGAASAGMHST